MYCYKLPYRNICLHYCSDYIIPSEVETEKRMCESEAVAGDGKEGQGQGGGGSEVDGVLSECMCE